MSPGEAPVAERPDHHHRGPLSTSTLRVVYRSNPGDDGILYPLCTHAMSNHEPACMPRLFYYGPDLLPRELHEVRLVSF